MTHFLHVIPLAGCLLGASSIALATSTTDLTVKGTITPNACGSTISSGGNADYGKISTKTLNPDQHTYLPTQILQLRIRCEGPTLFTLSTFDNRAGSSIVNSLHGLGMTLSDEKLGAVAFGLSNPVADSVPVRTIISFNGGVSWRTGSYLGHSALTAIASADGSSVPIAVKELDADLGIYPTIDHSDNLTLIDEVPIDGDTTIQFTYL